MYWYLQLHTYIDIPVSSRIFERTIKNSVYSFHFFYGARHFLYCKYFVKFFSRFLFGEKFAQCQCAQHPLALVSRWRVMRCVVRWQAGYTVLL